MSDEFLTLRVADIVAEAKDVVIVELKDLRGRVLPPFTSGAHIELHLSNGLIRHYSLCNDARERDRYRIGVGLARDSRGGSLLIHRALRVGDTMRGRPPRNTFPMVADTARHEFIAGGIGITPILSMIRACEAAHAEWHLTYLVRSRQRAAFYEELQRFSGRVTLHADDEAGALLDIPHLIRNMSRDAALYCCGPSPLMTAVESAAVDRPPAMVRFEWFVAGPQEPVAGRCSSFAVKLARSGRILNVPPERSILEVLEANGIDVPFSCREGFCGSCSTPVVSGQPDHRDMVLTDAEKARNNVMMVCCSRAFTELLELDL